MKTSSSPVPSTGVRPPYGNPNMASESAAQQILAKVLSDIAFLREKIALVESLRHPNTAVLHTYTDMLVRREMALALLQEGEQTRSNQN